MERGMSTDTQSAIFAMATELITKKGQPITVSDLSTTYGLPTWKAQDGLRYCMMSGDLVCKKYDRCNHYALPGTVDWDDVRSGTSVLEALRYDKNTGGGGLTIKQLSQITKASASAVYFQVRELQEAGDIKRHKNGKKDQSVYALRDGVEPPDTQRDVVKVSGFAAGITRKELQAARERVKIGDKIKTHPCRGRGNVWVTVVGIYKHVILCSDRNVYDYAELAMYYRQPRKPLGLCFGKEGIES